MLLCQLGELAALVMSVASSPSLHRLTSDPLPPTLLSDIKGLNALSEQQIQQLFAIAVRSLEGQTAAAEEEVAAFAHQHSVNEKPLRLVVSALLFVLSASLHRSLSADVLMEELQKLSVSAAASSTLSTLWRGCFVDLTGLVSGEVLSVNEVSELEWRFGVTAASSQLNKVGATFLQLRLIIDRGTHQQAVLMELSLAQFYSFLHEMQAADRQADALLRQ